MKLPTPTVTPPLIGKAQAKPWWTRPNSNLAVPSFRFPLPSSLTEIVFAWCSVRSPANSTRSFQRNPGWFWTIQACRPGKSPRETLEVSFGAFATSRPGKAPQGASVFVICFIYLSLFVISCSLFVFIVHDLSLFCHYLSLFFSYLSLFVVMFNYLLF